MHRDHLPSNRSPLRSAVLRSLIAVLGVAAVGILDGCGGAVPEILFAEPQLFLVHDVETDEVRESLRLFVAVRDDDGIEDISVLSIVQDESELYWQASAEDWVTVDQDGDSWIGLPDIRSLPADPFPRGRYRLVLEDAALQETEGAFSITAPVVDPRDISFPTLTGSGEAIEISATGPVILRVYSRAGKLLVSRQVEPGALGEDVLREIPDESGLSVYLSSPPGEAIRLLSGPFVFNR